MTYTIFLSHTQNDKRIAEAIKRIINDAFEGSIRFFLAIHDLGGGDAWKDSLKQRLLDCDAVISLLTDQSVAKPWIFIEWSAFWISDKKFYTLTTDEVRVANLVDPMKDRQATTVTDLDQVRSFFRSLARDSNHQKGTPFDFADDFVVAMNQAIAERNQDLANLSYARFRQSLVDLPREDGEKRKIAQWFYENREIEVAKRVTQEIRDDYIRAEMAIQLIRAGDLDNAAVVIETIRSADRLSVVARALIDHGYLDTRLVRVTIEDISTKNQAEMRALATYLVSLGEYDTDLFSYIVSNFSNMAELRKVAGYFVENRLTSSSTFNDLVYVLAEKSSVELRKILEQMKDYNLDKNAQPLFRQILDLIAQKNQKEAEKALIMMIETNSDLVRQYLDEGVITNTASKARLTNLLSSRT